jgi:hypothetical protein
LLSAEVAAIAEIAAAGVQAEKPAHCHPVVAQRAHERMERYREAVTAFYLRVFFLSSCAANHFNFSDGRFPWTFSP